MVKILICEAALNYVNNRSDGRALAHCNDSLTSSQLVAGTS